MVLFMGDVWFVVLLNSKALVELCEDDIVWKGDWVECVLHRF